jgi:hypothetical protein
MVPDGRGGPPVSHSEPGVLNWVSSASINIPNEAKRLLKTKDNVFPITINRFMKTNELTVQKSQEVIDNNGVGLS